MSRISDEKLFALLIGMPSIYLYLSGLAQLISICTILKNLVYPLAYLLGITALIRTINKRNNFLFIIMTTIPVFLTIIINKNIVKYLIDTQSIQGILTSDLVNLYLVAFPSFFIAKNIKDSNLLFKELYQIGKLIVSLFCITFFLIVFIYRLTFDYMNITYGVIPWLFFICGFSICYKKRITLLLSGISIFFILISGCRGAAIITLIFMILLYLSSLFNNFTIKKLILFIFLIVIGIIVLINFDSIISTLYYSLKGIGFNSRTLELYLGQGYEKTLNHYSDRAVLQIPLIKQFNLIGHGIYSDRLILGGVYAHNLFVEWIYDFGLFIGSLLSIYFIWNVLSKCWIVFRTDIMSLKIILASCISVILCKYMVSSSYLHAPEFWYLLGLIINKKMYFDNILKRENLKERD